jgi:hypothetical protein
MFRNLFALFSTFLVGAGAGSGPAAAATSPVSLEQRVQSAQDALGKLMDAEEPCPTADSYKLAKGKSEAPPGANNPPASGKPVGPPAARPNAWNNGIWRSHGGGWPNSWRDWGNWHNT